MFGKKKVPERRRPIYTGSQKPPTIQYYRSQSAPPPGEQGGRQNRVPEQRRTGQVTNHLKRFVKETTILLNLQGKPEFKRVAKATYALADKDEK